MPDFRNGQIVTLPAGVTMASTYQAEIDAVRAAAKAVADEAAAQKAKPNMSAQRVLLGRQLKKVHAEAVAALGRAVCGEVAGG